MDNRKIDIKRIVNNAIVLALYVILTFVSYPISFANFQFRLSELLVLLCFFNRDYVIGITLGCFLSNFASIGQMPFDFLIGTAATLISCLLISFTKHLAVAAIIPIVFNSFIVGIEYYYFLNIKPYMLGVGMIALGETCIILISYILIMIFMKKESMQRLVNANRNLDFKW